MSTGPSDPLEIHLLADSTGESGARLARAAVAQFPDVDFRLVRHRRITTSAALMTALEQVRQSAHRPIAVLFTMANSELAALVRNACGELDIPYADLMTDAMRALATISGTSPDEVPLRPVGVEADYFSRIAAIDFAVRNDDGAVPAALTECDICLVGPSRSGKTPLSIFLAYMGYRAVNVPLIPGIEPPHELYAVDKWRIVGLTLDPDRLQKIRSERVKGLGVAHMKDGYSDLARIYDELDAVRAVQRKLGCPVLNTTGMAIEESSARVVDLVEARAAMFGGHLRKVNVTSDLPAR